MPLQSSPLAKMTRTASFRRAIAMLIIVLAAVVCVVELVDIQVVQASALSEEARGKRAVPVTVPSVRGDIVDRNGQVLAMTDERYDVQLSPKNARLNGGKFFRADEDGVGTVEVTTADAFAEIGAITGQTAEEISRIVDEALEKNPDSDFAYVQRAVDLTQLNKLKNLDVPWITFAVNQQRTYPNGAVGGNLIGFTGADGGAQSGIELSQDVCLTGIDGAESYEKGADGVRLPGSEIVTQEAVDGGTVGLTIDLDLQYEAQQTIDEQVAAVSAEWGLLTIIDVKTGELVAVAEDASVDPNNVSAAEVSRRNARSFINPYEPGSTFKTITTAALFDQGKATPTTQVLTPGSWQPENGVRFSDSFAHGEMPWTLAGIMVQSSNVGISMLGSRMSEETRYDYLTKFGVGEATSTGMPIESAGLLHHVDDWDRQSSYNTMFGQALSSTIVQTASVYQTIGNGGVRLPPTLVAHCEDASGAVAKTDPAEPIEVVSEDAAANTLRILEVIATDGWISEHVAIPGYRIGGKTGTAQQADGNGGYRPDFIYSFAGVFPIDDPQYAIVSSVAFPAAGNGTIAALKAFHDAAEATIRTFHITPSTGAYDPVPLTY